MVPTAAYNPLMARKQSAPTIHPIAQASQQPQFQPQQPHASPSRARDRNQFDKIPPSQDVQQLPLLKGGSSMLTLVFRLRSCVPLPFFVYSTSGGGGETSSAS